MAPHITVAPLLVLLGAAHAAPHYTNAHTSFGVLLSCPPNHICMITRGGRDRGYYEPGWHLTWPLDYVTVVKTITDEDTETEVPCITSDDAHAVYESVTSRNRCDGADGCYAVQQSTHPEPWDEFWVHSLLKMKVRAVCKQYTLDEIRKDVPKMNETLLAELRAHPKLPREVVHEAVILGALRAPPIHQHLYDERSKAEAESLANDAQHRTAMNRMQNDKLTQAMAIARRSASIVAENAETVANATAASEAAAIAAAQRLDAQRAWDAHALDAQRAVNQELERHLRALAEDPDVLMVFKEIAMSSHLAPQMRDVLGMGRGDASLLGWFRGGANNAAFAPMAAITANA